MRNSASIERVHEWYEGWPPGGLKLQADADKWLAEHGAPVGSERQAALIAYYASNSALKRRGPRGWDKTYFRFMVHQTFFVLRFVEQGRPWRRDDESILPSLKMAYDAGYAHAVGYAYKFCFEKKIPLDGPRTGWIRRWRDGVVNEKLRMVTMKRRVGRPKGPSPKKWMEDLENFVLVDFWRGQLAGVYQNGKPHWFSFSLAFKATRIMLHGDTFFDAKDRRYLVTLKKSYERVVGRFFRVVSFR